MANHCVILLLNGFFEYWHTWSILCSLYETSCPLSKDSCIENLLPFNRLSVAQKVELVVH